MGIVEIILVALGLAADAFAAAVCIGLSIPKFTLKKGLFVGAFFGGFQAVMPLIGFFSAKLFAEKIIAIDHWVVFAILFLLGSKMILGTFKKEKSKITESSAHEAHCQASESDAVSVKKILPLAFATSIDALAIGITLALADANILSSVAIIGIVTFALSAAGVKIGRTIGGRFKSKAEILGGVILIIIAVKILFEHTGII